MSVMKPYVEYLLSRADFQTTLENERTSGIAVTCRKGD
jgi:hypothetical protein